MKHLRNLEKSSKIHFGFGFGQNLLLVPFELKSTMWAGSLNKNIIGHLPELFNKRNRLWIWKRWY